MPKKKHTGHAKIGSQFHLQNLVKDNPTKLNNAILNASHSLSTWISGNLSWVSLLAEDYEEYHDRRFLERVDCQEL